MRSLFLTTILALTALPLSAQNFSFFGTYWETEQGKSYEAIGLGIPASDMQRAFDAHTKDDRELTQIDAYDVGGDVFFNFVFRTRTSPSWVARWGMSGSDYQTFFDNQMDAGRCLRSLDVYRMGSQARYASVFKTHGCQAQRAYHGISAQVHQDRFDEFSADGWDPVNVSVVTIGGQRIYAVFYEKRDGGSVLRSFLTRDQLDQENTTQASSGRRIVYMNAYTHDQNQLPRFSAIWRKASAPAKTWANIGGPQVFDLGDEMHDSNRYIRYLTGYGVGSGHRYDGAAIKPRAAVGGVGGIGN